MNYTGSYALIAADGSELQHFGTLGMKWGVRNYQNEDGSLTPAGKERYGSKIENYKTGVERTLTKTASNAQYYQQKASKYYDKADANRTRLLFNNEKLASKQESKGRRNQAKANRYVSRGANYYKKSKKTLSKIDSSDSLTAKSISIGENFVEQQIKNSKMSYYLK